MLFYDGPRRQRNDKHGKLIVTNLSWGVGSGHKAEKEKQVKGQKVYERYLKAGNESRPGVRFRLKEDGSLRKIAASSNRKLSSKLLSNRLVGSHIRKSRYSEGFSTVGSCGSIYPQGSA